MTKDNFCCAPSHTTSLQDLSRQHYLTTLEFMKNITPHDEAFDYCTEMLELYAKYNGRCE